MLGAILIGLMGAYVTYRLGLTVRAAQARRDGDVDREAELRARGFALMMRVGVGTVFVCVGLLFLL